MTYPDQVLNAIEALCSRPGKERSGHAHKVLAIIQDCPNGDDEPTQAPSTVTESAAVKLEQIKLACAAPAARNSRTAQEVLAIIGGEDLQAWSAKLPKRLRMQP